MTPAPDLITLPSVPSGSEVIRRIAAETDTILLAFSGGKDALAAWLACRPHFRRIVPFHMFGIPGRQHGTALGFVEKSLRYYERYFGTHIYRVPHPSLYRKLRNLVYQPPERCEIIEAANLPSLDYEDIRQIVAEDHGLDPATTWYASGVRAADSPNRRANFRTHGVVTERRHVFYPVWDLRKDGLVSLFREHKVKLSAEYRIFGRSFDGIDHRFLAPIKQHWPDDYARILEFFPLADLELMRAAQAREHYGRVA